MNLKSVIGLLEHLLEEFKNILLEEHAEYIIDLRDLLIDLSKMGIEKVYFDHKNLSCQHNRSPIVLDLRNNIYIKLTTILRLMKLYKKMMQNFVEKIE